MINILKTTLIIIVTFSHFNFSCAADNPDAPDILGQFKVNEKIYLKAIEEPKNGTRDTIRAYHKYKIFLDQELNKTYNILKSKLSPERQKELKKSQVLWLKYRDAEFELINHNWDRTTFGSSFAISRGDYSSTIIKNRLLQLLNYTSNYL